MISLCITGSLAAIKQLKDGEEKMFKVRFESRSKVKEGRKFVIKHYQWNEFIKTEQDAKLRAMALNWTIVSIEKSYDHLTGN